MSKKTPFTCLYKIISVFNFSINYLLVLFLYIYSYVETTLSEIKLDNEKYINNLKEKL